MRRRWRPAIALLALACSGPDRDEARLEEPVLEEPGLEEPGRERPAGVGVLQVRDAWTRLLPGVGAIYLTIVNDSGGADRLVAVETPAAVTAMLHATVEEGEIAKMVEHGRGFEIAAGATLELAPGGRHVMLMEPAAGVAAGDTIAVTLRFERAGDLEIEVPVRGADGS